MTVVNVGVEFGLLEMNSQVNTAANYYDSSYILGSGICKHEKRLRIDAHQWETKARVFRKGF